MLERSALRAIPTGPLSESALNTIIDDPRYGRVHALARRFLSPQFQLRSGDTPVSIRPSYGVYDLWCFLALERALSAALPDFRWVRRGVANLLTMGGTGAGAALVGAGNRGRVVAMFNATFAAYPGRQGRDRWSLSGQRRPDFIVKWEPREGSATWLVMDAKYRIGRNLVDAFASLHVYRDALHWNTDGGRSCGGVLLAPARTAETDIWFAETIREHYGIGAIELRPDVPVTPLAEWILGTLRVDGQTT